MRSERSRADDVATVHVRQQHIDDANIIVVVTGKLDRFLSATGLIRNGADRAERMNNRARRGLVAIHNKNTHHHPPCSDAHLYTTHACILP
jgi:hypothetical protein